MRKEKWIFPKEYKQRADLFPYKIFPQGIFLQINEHEHLFLFEDERLCTVQIELKTALSEKEYEELQHLNQHIFKLETDNYRIIYLHMGTFAIISAITGVILASVVNWAYQHKSGRVYTEDREYKFERNTAGGQVEILRRRADVSYISYNDVAEDEQKTWTSSFIKHAPTLVIEIVSSAKSLQTELNKMNEVWMKQGTRLGLVICPYSKKVYIFENNQAQYREQSIFESFTHSLLSGYNGDFSKYVNEL